jgi:hypothetical protein
LHTTGAAAKLPGVRHGHWLLIVPAPLLLTGFYWLLVDGRSGGTDWVVMALGVAIGLAGIWSAPWPKAARAGASLAYVPLMGLVLTAYVLALECSTGNCL